MRRLSVLAALAAAGSLCVPAAPSSGGPTDQTYRSVTGGKLVREHLLTAIKRLKIAPHSYAASYDRDEDFGDWIDQGGGCDTRAVVLKKESLKRTTQNSDCTIETGKWLSYYNDKIYKQASRLQRSTDGLSDEFLRHVAAAYRQAVAEGRSPARSWRVRWVTAHHLARSTSGYTWRANAASCRRSAAGG